MVEKKEAGGRRQKAGKDEIDRTPEVRPIAFPAVCLPPPASCFLFPAFCLLPIAFYVRLYLVSPIIGHDGLAAHSLLPQSATWVGRRLGRHTARNQRRRRKLEEGVYFDPG